MSATHTSQNVGQVTRQTRMEGVETDMVGEGSGREKERRERNQKQCLTRNNNK